MYSIGAHLEHDTVDFQKIRAQMVCQPERTIDGPLTHAAYKSTFWLRADMKREFLGAGCDNALKDSIKHSWEALYCWRQGFKGIQGQPVKLLGGVAYDLGKTSSLTASAEVGENWMVRSAATHKLDKNWTVGVNQRFDSAKMARDQAPYDIGFTMTYKL